MSTGAKSKAIRYRSRSLGLLSAKVMLIRSFYCDGTCMEDWDCHLSVFGQKVLSAKTYLEKMIHTEHITGIWDRIGDFVASEIFEKFSIRPVRTGMYREFRCRISREFYRPPYARGCTLISEQLMSWQMICPVRTGIRLPRLSEISAFWQVIRQIPRSNILRRTDRFYFCLSFLTKKYYPQKYIQKRWYILIPP